MLSLPFKISSVQQLQDILQKDCPPDLEAQLKEDPKGTLLGIIKEPPTEEDYQKYATQTVNQLKKKVEDDEKLVELIRYDPVNFIKKVIKDTMPPQFRVYKILVGSLCIVLVMIVVGVLVAWLMKNSREPPTLITAMACSIIGILAGIFVNVPGRIHRADGPDKDNHSS